MLAFRRDRILLAALLGSLAVTVRPLMIFVLVGTGLMLVYQRRFRPFLAAFVIGLAIGILYTFPLAHYLGDPLLTVHTYTTRDYGRAGIRGPPWTSVRMAVSWNRCWHAHLFRAVDKLSPEFLLDWARVLGRGDDVFEQVPEICEEVSAGGDYCGSYLIAIFSYDYPIWARSNFVRFCIPVLPFVFFALLPVLPKSRSLLWGLCILNAILAAASAIGVRNVIGRLP